MSTIALHAHFDGQKIVLDEPFELQPDARLIVTVLSEEQSDLEHDSWLEFSKAGLARGYSENEPEYSLDLIKKANPEYERR